ncbi:MAG: aspartate aminotransferase family protein [Ginsengibacter sp.]
MNTNRSLSNSQLLEEANNYIAGGVVSLNRKVSPNISFSHAKGSKLYDVDGKEYIDYHAAFAPHILGHNHEAVSKAVLKVIAESRSLIGSGTNELEISLAKKLCMLIPSLEKVQITNTGSEATAHAIRLSRAYTGRDDIVLTLGGYNGWHNEVSRAVMPSIDQLGSRISPGEYPFIPLSAGIPNTTKRCIHVVNYNDLDSVEYIMKRYPVACVLTEPVLQNVGVILPHDGYLQGLIDLCQKYGAVSIFDEVKTGFRSHLKGYQHLAKVRPDLSVFGKAIANGYPMGVIGGRNDIMQLFDSRDPLKRVLIAGTYNAHPINVAAALATIEMLEKGPVYNHLQEMATMLYNGFENIFAEKGITMTLSRNASAHCMYFMDHAPVDLHDILNNHAFDLDIRIRKSWIENGIYHIPIPCKQGSISYAHSEGDVEKTLEVTRKIVNGI